MKFDWDEPKNQRYIAKHQLSFYEAQKAFDDARRVIAEDLAHSSEQERRYCGTMSVIKR